MLAACPGNDLLRRIVMARDAYRAVPYGEIGDRADALHLLFCALDELGGGHG